MTTPLVFASHSPRTSLPYLFAAQAQKEATVNESLARIDALLAPHVEGFSASPPASPADGECWVVAADPQGDWDGKDYHLAVFTAGAWLFVAPQPAMEVFDRSAGALRRWTNGWQFMNLPAPPAGGSTIDAEARAAITALIDKLRASGIGV